MKIGFTVFALCTICLVGPAQAVSKAPCPPREEGANPWGVNELMPGDYWAWVYLDIDKDGKPTACRMGENNIRSQNLRSNICRSFVRNWTAVPVLVDGKPTRTTIKRRFVAMGDKHAKAYDEARERFFRENPNERRECYRG